MEYDNVDINCPSCGVKITVSQLTPMRPIKPGCEELWPSIEMIITAFEMENRADQLPILNWLRQFQKIADMPCADAPTEKKETYHLLGGRRPW